MSRDDIVLQGREEVYHLPRAWARQSSALRRYLETGEDVNGRMFTPFIIEKVVEWLEGHDAAGAEAGEYDEETWTSDPEWSEKYNLLQPSDLSQCLLAADVLGIDAMLRQVAEVVAEKMNAGESFELDDAQVAKPETARAGEDEPVALDEEEWEEVEDGESPEPVATDAGHKRKSTTEPDQTAEKVVVIADGASAKLSPTAVPTPLKAIIEAKPDPAILEQAKVQTRTAVESPDKAL